MATVVTIFNVFSYDAELEPIRTYHLPDNEWMHSPQSRVFLIPNDDKQNYHFCKLKSFIEKAGHMYFQPINFKIDRSTIFLANELNLWAPARIIKG